MSFLRKSMFAVGMTALVLTAGLAPAAAQDYPGTTAGGVCGGDALSGRLVPGGVGVVVGVCAGFTVGELVDLQINSTPIFVPPVRVDAGKAARWSGFAVPGDFELNAFHTAVSRNSAGRIVLSGRFFVDANGNITSGPTTPGRPAKAPKAAVPLARTGSDFTDDGIKIAGTLLAAGGVVLLAAKRRRGSAVPAR